MRPLRAGRAPTSRPQAPRRLWRASNSPSPNHCRSCVDRNFLAGLVGSGKSDAQQNARGRLQPHPTPFLCGPSSLRGSPYWSPRAACARAFGSRSGRPSNHHKRGWWRLTSEHLQALCTQRARKCLVFRHLPPHFRLPAPSMTHFLISWRVAWHGVGACLNLERLAQPRATLNGDEVGFGSGSVSRLPFDHFGCVAGGECAVRSPLASRPLLPSGPSALIRMTHSDERQLHFLPTPLPFRVSFPRSSLS